MNFSNKHIVFLTPGFAQNEQDTTTIPALQEYIFALKNEEPQLKITIIAFQFPFNNKSYNWHNCTIIPLNGKNSKLKKIFVWQKAYSTLKKIHQECPIGILHSFWIGECSLIGQYFTTKKNINSIVTAMGQDVFKNKYALFLNKNTTKIVTLSKNHHDELFKNYNIESKIIPWGITKKRFLNSTIKTIDIIGVGSLITLKNYELFIDVIFEINKNTSLKIILIGDGTEKEKLQEKIKRLNLENTITLTGLLSYQKTLEYLSKAKVLLHTSNYESFGMIFPEALESKTFIVSKNVGCAFSMKNWIITETKEEMILACRKALTMHFSEKHLNPYVVEKTVENYLKLYNE